MSQLGCIGSGNKSQRKTKGPRSLGQRKEKVMCWAGGGLLEVQVCSERVPKITFLNLNQNHKKEKLCLPPLPLSCEEENLL